MTKIYIENMKIFISSLFLQAFDNNLDFLESFYLFFCTMPTAIRTHTVSLFFMKDTVHVRPIKILIKRLKVTALPPNHNGHNTSI